MATAPFDLEDTALARLLHQRGLVRLSDLQACLEQVRAGRSGATPVTLAGVLTERGLLSPQQIEETLSASASWLGVSSSSSGRFAAPTQLGPYRLVRELARGGMGAVHEAVHEPTGVRYAVKTIQPAGLSGALDAGERSRFAAEATLMARLEHPNVARIHAAVLDAATPYLVQDLLSGGSLKERLDRGGVFAPSAAAALTAKLARGLAHAHALGVLHRDLKPSNVLFDERGEPRLVDFGLARALDSEGRLTATGDILGTPGYLSPEQALGEKGDDPRTDVYGLGGVLYAALTGRPPVAPASSLIMTLGRVAAGEVVPPRQVNPDVPADLNAICLKALATAPDERYPSANAFAEALETGTRPPRSRRGPAWVALSGLLAAGVGVLALSGGEEPPRPTPPERPQATSTPAATPSPPVAPVEPVEPVAPVASTVVVEADTIPWAAVVGQYRAVTSGRQGSVTRGLELLKRLRGEKQDKRNRLRPIDPRAAEPALTAAQVLRDVDQLATALTNVQQNELARVAIRGGAVPPRRVVLPGHALELRHGLFGWARLTPPGQRIPNAIADRLIDLVAFDPFVRMADVKILEVVSSLIAPNDRERHARLADFASQADALGHLCGLVFRRASQAMQDHDLREARRLRLLRLLVRASLVKRGSEAFEHTEQALQGFSRSNDPQERAEADTGLAVLHQRRGDEQEALQALARARLVAEPRTPRVRLIWARVYRRLRRWAETAVVTDAYLERALVQWKQRTQSPRRRLPILPGVKFLWVSARDATRIPLVERYLQAWHPHLPRSWLLRYAWLCAARKNLVPARELVVMVRSEDVALLSRLRGRQAELPPERRKNLTDSIQAAETKVRALDRVLRAFDAKDRRRAADLLSKPGKIMPKKLEWYVAD